jgi:hypothetical protein
MWEMEIRRIMAQGQDQAKSETPISTNKLVWWHRPVTPAKQEG